MFTRKFFLVLSHIPSGALSIAAIMEYDTRSFFLALRRLAEFCRSSATYLAQLFPSSVFNNDETVDFSCWMVELSALDRWSLLQVATVLFYLDEVLQTIDSSAFLALAGFFGLPISGFSLLYTSSQLERNHN